jgi:hypothetical protein
MFVLCVLYSKDKRQNQDKEVQIKYREQKEIKSGVAGEFFRSYRQNHVPWGRLCL